MEYSFDTIKQGLMHEMQKITEPSDSASRYDSGLLDVFSTPALVAFMEGTAYRAVQRFLPAGFSTVGCAITITHSKATPIGKRVRCLAELMNRDGKKLEFNVKAWDDEGVIGEGSHMRVIIHEQNFIDRMNKGNSEKEST